MIHYVHYKRHTFDFLELFFQSCEVYICVCIAHLVQWAPNVLRQYYYGTFVLEVCCEIQKQKLDRKSVV